MRILVADCTADFCAMIREAFAAEEDLEVVDCTQSGRIAWYLVQTLCPDVLLVDVVLPELDGLCLVRRIQEDESLPKPKVIFVSSIAYPAMFEEAKTLDAYFFMQKPVDMDTLKERVRSVGKNAAASAPAPDIPPAVNADLASLIAGLLHKAGIPSHLAGFRLLREAAVIAVENQEAAASITKLIYPELAARFSINSSSVERNISYAISHGWKNAKATNNEWMRRCFPGRMRKPSNSEFIAAIAGCAGLHPLTPEDDEVT